MTEIKRNQNGGGGACLPCHAGYYPKLDLTDCVWLSDRTSSERNRRSGAEWFGKRISKSTKWRLAERAARRHLPGSLYAVQIRHAEKGHRRSEAAARLLAHEQLWVAPPASQVAHIIAPGHSCVGGMPVVAVPDEEDVGPVPVPHHSLESVRLGCGGDARYVEWCGRSN